MNKAKAPHMAIINLHIEVFDLLPTGECSGNAIPVSELKEANLNSRMLLSVSGFDKADCLNKLRQKILEFHNG